MRIFALSDIHADYRRNYEHIKKIPADGYNDSALIVAGDISHNTGLLRSALEILKVRFAVVVFVPGNHDLWLRDDFPDSLEKFNGIRAMCSEIDVATHPVRIASDSGPAAWIVPLFAWYALPEHSPSSLFVCKHGEDDSLRIWSDMKAVRWPACVDDRTPEEYFLGLNEPFLKRTYDGTVISCSHVLPRAELMFPTERELRAWAGRLKDPQPRFNFSRVAGSSTIDRQIRELGSAVHVYGHQHRNRCRTLEGIHYISHCLGYPRERQQGRIIGDACTPRLIWDGSGPCVD